MSWQFNKKRFCCKKDENDLGQVLIERPFNGLIDLTCCFYSICRDDFSVIAIDLLFVSGVEKQTDYLFPTIP